MVLVEKELTMKNVERAKNNPELEKLNETEQKLIPTRPEVFEALFKESALPIEQLYLSTPHDEFSLRVRSAYKQTGVEYTATLKSRGEIVGNGLKRGEIETPISEEAYERYAAMEFPMIRKLRAKVMDGITVDFYDNPKRPVVVEIEHEDYETRALLLKQLEALTEDTFIDCSDNPAFTNEAMAYEALAHTKGEAFLPKAPESLDHFSARVLDEMIARYATGKDRVVVGLTGMSGSGKTTVTRAIQERITELYGEDFTPNIISTDDYHFGKKRLEMEYGAPYTEWDDGKTYDTAQLTADLRTLEAGLPIPGRHFDFETEEPAFDGVINASPFVILEGLYAGSKNLQEVRDLHFCLPTGIATALGRDVRRLVIDNRANRAFPTAQSRLQYQIETALPKYLEQEAPSRTPFSASVRTLADRAFMLEKLR